LNQPLGIVLGPDIEAISALGSRGVRVIVATDEDTGALAHSTFVAGIERSPSRWAGEYEAWFEALLQRYPGCVVFPWGDATAWWIARWRGRNPSSPVRVVTPAMDAFAQVVPKFRLYGLCRAAGIEAPRTWLAPDEESALRGAEGARYPLMVKPQSRIGNLHWGQGQVARDAAELRETVAWALAAMKFREQVTDSLPGIDVPMVQEVVGGRDRPVYHLAGYVTGATEAALLAHRKLLQAPRRFGNGLCFETAPVDEQLAEKLVGMLRSIGYHGMFEAEFLERGKERLLIDLNTRVYNGMRLEVERGLNPAWLAYLEAIGDRGRLGEGLALASGAAEQPGLVWCRRLEFVAMVSGQFVSGGFRLRDVGCWMGWYRAHRHTMVDPWQSAGDRRLGRRRLLHQLKWWAKSPRQFAGVYVRRESGR
jgi:predicted ATP-grasp superfamily ATP-dependent carboligase